MSFEVNYEEDLVSRIRDLIDGYSKNSILKEYLQNADDSGATELVVTFDKRIHTSLIDTSNPVTIRSGPDYYKCLASITLSGLTTIMMAG